MVRLKKLWNAIIVAGIFALAGLELFLLFVGILVAVVAFVSIPFCVLYFMFWLFAKIFGIVLALF